MRPLYIDGTTRPFVAVDGPSLLVRRSGAAAARFPFRFISRIVVRGAAEWSTDALIACMDTGILVAFLDETGNARGYCIAAAGRDTDVNLRIEDCIQLPAWPARRENWLCAVERRGIRQAFKHLGLPAPDDFRPAVCRQRLARRIDEPGMPVSATAILAVLTGLLSAHLAALLRRRGIWARFVAGSGDNALIDLLGDFRRVLTWSLYPDALALGRYFRLHPRHCGQNSHMLRRVARRYEAHAPMIERHFHDLFKRFEWLLQDMLP